MMNHVLCGWDRGFLYITYDIYIYIYLDCWILLLKVCHLVSFYWRRKGFLKSLVFQHCCFFDLFFIKVSNLNLLCAIGLIVMRDIPLLGIYWQYRLYVWDWDCAIYNAQLSDSQLSVSHDFGLFGWKQTHQLSCWQTWVIL